MPDRCHDAPLCCSGSLLFARARLGRPFDFGDVYEELPTDEKLRFATLISLIDTTRGTPVEGDVRRAIESFTAERTAAYLARLSRGGQALQQPRACVRVEE